VHEYSVSCILYSLCCTVPDIGSDMLVVYNTYSTVCAVLYLPDIGSDMLVWCMVHTL
jgi:hypothetical protein